METVVQMSLEELEKIKQQEYQKGVADSATHTLITHRHWSAKVFTNDEAVKKISEELIREREENEVLKSNLAREINKVLKLKQSKKWWQIWK